MKFIAAIGFATAAIAASLPETVRSAPGGPGGPNSPGGNGGDIQIITGSQGDAGDGGDGGKAGGTANENQQVSGGSEYPYGGGPSRSQDQGSGNYQLNTGQRQSKGSWVNQFLQGGSPNV